MKRYTRPMGPKPFARFSASRYDGSGVDVLRDFKSELAEAASLVGAQIDRPLELDGRRHYLRNLDGRDDQRQYYIGSIEQSQDKTVWPCVTFSTFKAGIPNVYFNPRNLVWAEFLKSRSGLPPITERTTEYARRACARIAQQAQEEARRIANDTAGHQAAANAALEAWDAARECGEHFYLEAKQVKSYGLRVAISVSSARLWKPDQELWSSMLVVKHGDLLIPMYDVDGKLCNLQRIEALPVEGKYPRRFLNGSRKRGLFFRIGGDGPAFLTEGYATAATVHAATGMPVYVAFDAHNMAEVARLHSETIYMVAADNDASGAGEKGARLTGHPYKMPPTVGHDWNDHARKFGLNSVRAMLLGSHNAA